MNSFIHPILQSQYSMQSSESLKSCKMMLVHFLHGVTWSVQTGGNRCALPKVSVWLPFCVAQNTIVSSVKNYRKFTSGKPSIDLQTNTPNNQFLHIHGQIFLSLAILVACTFLPLKKQLCIHKVHTIPM